MELVVSLLILVMFAVMLVLTLSLTLRWWTQIKDPTLAEQNARTAADAIAAEFSQAIINPNANTTTPIVTPATVGASGSTLTFWETSASYDTLLATYLAGTPTTLQALSSSAYQEITYSVGTNSSGNSALLRAVNSNTAQPVISMTYSVSSTGSPAMAATFTNLNAYGPAEISISVSCSEYSEGGVGTTGGGTGTNTVFHECTLTSTAAVQQ